MIVKFKKLQTEAVAPSYSKAGDAGTDLTAISFEWSTDYVEYKTGIAVEIPFGHVGLLFPRSSISNTALSLTNSVGVLDSGFRGEITFRFRLNKLEGRYYGAGDRIGQLLIIPYPSITLLEACVLSDTERGSGGYGSTGR